MKALLQKIRRILKDRRTRQMLTRIISVTAAIVVFITTYALVLPAVTMESEADCGIEAHQHDDSCYEELLSCGLEESEGHQHDDSCYRTRLKLSCELEEHVHVDRCYDEAGNLICEKTEHTHSEENGCYEEVRELVCGIPESEGHRHDASCYEKVLTCGKEVHTHSAACYESHAQDTMAVSSTESAAAESAYDAGEKAAGIPEGASEFAGETAETANDAYVGADPDGLAAETAAGAAGTGLAEEADGVFSIEEEEGNPGASTEDTLAEDAAGNQNALTEGAAGIETDGSETAETVETADTAASTAAPTAAGYVPVLEEVNFTALLNKKTGIYYSRPATAEGEKAGEEKAEGGDSAASYADAASAAGAAELVWNKTDKNTELGESDLLRVYLSYTIPAGSLNETNATARYRIPGNIRLTDDQMNTINTTVNGIAGQYVSYDTLEILDPENYEKTLGIEAVEGTRKPDQDVNEYLAGLQKSGKDVVEYISATVKAENVFDENSGAFAGQDLIFTFTPYTVGKNQHEYDAEGQPTKAGEEVRGWVAFDLTTDQVEWVSAETAEKTTDIDENKESEESGENTERTARIIFAAKDRENKIDEISTELKMTAKMPASNEAAGEDDFDDTGEIAADVEEDGDGEEHIVNYPPASFDNAIIVSAGSLATDTDKVSDNVAEISKDTEISVHVEADEGTFPEGTTMVLSGISRDQMPTVAEAVAGAVEAPKTMGFHALDISFRDKEGNEIEPLRPIRVSMTSDAIRRAVEDASTAPVVVHVSDPEADSGANAEGLSEVVEGTEAAEASGTEGNAADTLTFEAGEFSVYAIVYTVDFHWEVNGKVYDFSIPGGGFAGFYNLVESLGIEANDTNTEKDEIQELVDNVDNIMFSDPELVSVSRIEEDSTVGAVKDRLGLECKYSSELTEAQITEINAQTVKAGDWALISMQPFTSEETLTVTMKSGDQFVVKVTDAQIRKTVIDAKGDKWEITVTYGEDAQIPQGAELRVREILPEDREYQKYYDQSLKTAGVMIRQDTNTKESVNKGEAGSEQEYKAPEVPVDNYARIFDIEIWADDTKIEPKSNVTVDIKLLETPEKSDLLPHVVHFSGNGTELMELSGKSKTSENDVQFETDEFSVYSVVYTCDLLYDVETGTLSYEDNKIKVTVSAKEEKEIFPDKAVLIVKELVPEDEDSANTYARALTALSNTLREQNYSFSAVKVYDFSILDGEGNEIEPNGEVAVKIEYKKKPELSEKDGMESDIQIAHLVEDPSDKEGMTVEFVDADIDATALGTVSGAEFTTDSFSAYIVFNKDGISQKEPTDLGNYGWIKFFTAGEQDTTPNQTGDPDSPTIQWGYYKNNGSNLPALNTAWAYRRILKVRLWLPKSGQNTSVYDSDHYNEAATAQYFWVWQNEVNIEEFELPGYEVVHTRMHSAWDEENGREPVENDSLVGSYTVRGYRRSTLSNEPGAKNSDLNVLDIYAKPLPQTTGMNYIIRYVHADGSVTDGNVRSLSSGSVTYNAGQYQRDGEVYAGTSIITGSEAINANTAAGTGTITYKTNVPLAKVYVYYKINPSGNGNPNAKGRYDKDENGYYTGAKGLYTDKSAEAISGKDRQYILNLESWYVDNAASVGMVLDASGSMAWTSGEPEPIVLTDAQVAEVRRANGMQQDNLGRWYGSSDIFFNGGSNDAAGTPPNTGQYITNFSALSKILDKTKTDNSAMGYNGYHYYLKDMRSTVREYVALGYSDGNQSGSESLGGKTIYTTQIGNTSYSGTVLANRFIQNQNNAHGQNEGWYYVNSTGNTKAYYKYTGKSYDGYSSKGWWPSANDPNRFNLAGGPLRFYIKTGTNELWVSYYNSSDSEIRQSPVYEKRDKMFTKMETLQDAVSQFGAIVLGSSPDSQIGLTRFSQQVKTATNDDNQWFNNTSYLPLLNWSSSTEELAAAMNLSKNSKGSTSKNDDGLTVYEYGLTGQTRTWTGVKAYSDYLKNNATAANHKYLIIFTDGKDTNGDADSSTWGQTGTQIQALKNAGYTIITVMMRSQAMIGSEYTTAKAFLQGIASPGLDGNASNTAADNKLYFEADSNSTKDVIDAFRRIANRIASGLNGYTVRDYIDPRFDVLNDAGDVLTVLDSNGQFTHTTNPDVDASTGLRAFTTPDNKQAYLGYDTTKKMFYILWKDQEIPASTLQSTSVNPWKSQVRIQAKADFLGGNDILSNGNETGMNQVYYPNSTDSSGMTPTINNTNYPSKVFPATTTNPGTLKIELDNYEDTIFLGDMISPQSLYSLVQTDRTPQTVDDRALYFDYLTRAGEKFQDDPTYYVHLIKYASVPTAATNTDPSKDKDGNPIQDFVFIHDANGVSILTLPYYYLEEPGDNTSYAGGSLHQGDKVGTVTYTWKAITTGGHTLTDSNALKDYTSTTLDTVRYQLSVSYAPDAYDGTKIINNNSGIISDNIPNNGSVRTQTLTNQKGTGNLIRDPVGSAATAKSTDTNTQGLAAIHVVAGKIKVKKRIEITEDSWNKLVAKAGDTGLTFTFTINKDGAEYGTVSINTKTSTSTVSGDYIELSSEWVTGLPKGDYTIVETAMPEGFTFQSISADTVINADGDNNDGIQFAAPVSGNVIWKIGQKDGGKPTATTYGNTDFSAAKVKDSVKEVDPDKEKAYLNAQIGKGIIVNEPPRTTEISLWKVDSVSGNALTGAKFSLKEGAVYSNLDGLTITNKTTGAAISIEMITVNGVSVKVFEIPAEGIKIEGLVNGTYTLTEEVIPDGYVALEGGRTFKADSGVVKKADDSGSYVNEDANFTFKVQNEPGVELPSTGGPGTTALYLIGIMLTAFAGAGFVMRMRRRDAA